MRLRHFLRYPGGRVDLPNHRALVWHIFDTESWRKKNCPECGRRFTEDPRFSFLSYDLHFDCADSFIEKWYQNHADDYNDEPTDSSWVGVPE